MSADEPQETQKQPKDSDSENGFFGGPIEPTSPLGEEEAKLAANVARLQTFLDGERESRREERFIWGAVVSLLLDVIAVQGMDNSWAFIPIFLLQLVILIGFAKYLGVDWAEQLIGQLFYRYLQPKPPKKDE